MSPAQDYLGLLRYAYPLQWHNRAVLHAPSVCGGEYAGTDCDSTYLHACLPHWPNSVVILSGLRYVRPSGRMITIEWSNRVTSMQTYDNIFFSHFSSSKIGYIGRLLLVSPKQSDRNWQIGTVGIPSSVFINLQVYTGEPYPTCLIGVLDNCREH